MQIGFTTLTSLARIRDCRSKRSSSFDRQGANNDAIPIKPGKRLVIADLVGPGCIKHIWSTNSHAHNRDAMRSLVLRIWWDDEPEASVECPLRDFFGLGHGERIDYVSMPLQMSPKEW